MPAVHQVHRFHDNFDGFLSCMRSSEGAGTSLSPERFGEVLDLDVQTLAAQAHVHRNTVRRAPTSPSIQHYLREALRVIRVAFDISGDVEGAIFWYRNVPLPPFDYKTAEQLVSEERTEDLIRYVHSLEAGALG